jgi:uncharacterized protein (DUF302 family)
VAGGTTEDAVQDQNPRPLDEIERGLLESVVHHRFGVIAIHDLRDTMRKKGVELAMACRIYEVCNPLQAKKVLEADGAISTALPCRISVYGSEGGHTLATMRPTEMMKIFANADIERVAQEVEEVVLQMMRDAAGEGDWTGGGDTSVNDAPALKQAEVGVAVANATDVAKAAASIVLTNPGLGDVVSAVETSRRIYQRMLTYTLNKIIKTLEVAPFLSLGVMLTRTRGDALANRIASVY